MYRTEAAAGETSEALDSELLWLLGQPHLDDYLALVRDRVVGGAHIAASQSADDWRAANDRYHELEKSEAGLAEQVQSRPLDLALTPLAEALRAHPHYRATFDTVPSQIMMVELDKLIVAQTYVVPGFAQSRARILGRKPDPAALFRFCLPLERDLAPVRVQRLGAERYLFTCPSTDLRPHEPALLAPDQLAAIDTFGPIAGVVALAVGFGSNFLSAISSEGRLVLHNGYHRAFALRSLGIKHAPCIVQTVTRRDELMVAASERVSEFPELYFRARRPPLLRDFFNPALCKRLRVKRQETMVEVEFKTRAWTADDCSDL